MLIKRFIGLAALLPLVAAAQGTPHTPTLGDLARIQAHTIILKAEAAQAAAAASLAAKGGAGDVGATAPVVSDVYGGRGLLFASFLYSDGATVVARAGETIPGGYRVRSIALNAVRIERAGKIIDVGFSGTAPIPAAPPATTPSLFSPIQAPAVIPPPQSNGQ